MPILISDLVNDAQKVHLGDEQAEMYDLNYLLTFVPKAFRDVAKVARLAQSRLVRRRVFARCPANSSPLIYPQDIEDMGTSLISLAVRREESFIEITAVSPTVDPSPPTYTTFGPHGRVVGDVVQVVGVRGYRNANVEAVVIDVPNSVQLTVASSLRGSALISPPGGISYALGPWLHLEETSHRGFIPSGHYRFENGRYEIQVEEIPRQVMFEYRMEPYARTFALTDVLEEERFRDAIALKIALLAGHKKIDPSLYIEIERQFAQEIAILKGEMVRDLQQQIMIRPRHHTVVRHKRLF
jgi:hypothetical protein